MSDATPRRRVPQQARSRQRYDAVLDAAAALIVEQGHEAVTTNHIAERAGVSIGSLYQYFPHKEAVLYALGERYLEELERIHAATFSVAALENLPLETLLDQFIDPFITFYSQHPAFTLLFIGSDVSAYLANATANMDAEVINLIKQVLLHRVPELDDTRAQTIATVVKGVVKALFALLYTATDPAQHDAYSAEIKQVLRAYLSPLLHEA